MVNKEFYEEIKGQGIPSEYKGYISTFGAMVIQNGLIPALAYFEKNEADQTAPRKEHEVKVSKESTEEKPVKRVTKKTVEKE